MSCITEVKGQTWIEKGSPNIVFVSKCFFKAYHAQKKVPGMAATTCDFVNSISKAVIERCKGKISFCIIQASERQHAQSQTQKKQKNTENEFERMDFV